MDKTPGPKPRTNVFGYLDETGLLHTPATDKVFGLGLLVCQTPSQLHRAIIAYKNSKHYYSEFKFTNVRDQNLSLYKGFIDLLFCQNNVRFVCIVHDKQQINMSGFGNDHEKAYSVLTAQLVSKALTIGSTADSEYLAILADDVSTSKNDRFEKIVKEKVKHRLRRNAVFGIARLESHAISELQLCDVLLGTVAYSFKIKYGIVKGESAKVALVKHLQKMLNISKLSTEVNQKLKGGIYVVIQEHGQTK